MKSNFEHRPQLGAAPRWAEETAPKGLLRRDTPSLLLICMPQEEEWFVASREESDAIADPGSFMGTLLRPHCALLSLPYTSNN